MCSPTLLLLLYFLVAIVLIAFGAVRCPVVWHLKHSTPGAVIVAVMSASRAEDPQQLCSWFVCGDSYTCPSLSSRSCRGCSTGSDKIVFRQQSQGYDIRLSSFGHILPDVSGLFRYILHVRDEDARIRTCFHRCSILHTDERATALLVF